jgi:hypothetical protein
MEWGCDEIRKRGFDCNLREKDEDDFKLEGSLSSAWLFHVQIIEPRKMKLPIDRRKVHEEAMAVLPRQVGRGFGKKIRRQSK